MNILEVKGVTSGYGGMDILHDVSLKIEKGERISVIGPNGAGKSTLMRTIFGLIKPKKGQVLFKNQDITGLSPDRIVRKGMCYVPQSDNIFPSLTVEENFEMGAFIREDNYKGRIQEIYEIFPPLGGKRNRKAGKLSGGERQMVAMGRALMLDPVLLLLDEPSAGLAPLLVEMIFEKIKDINSSGVSILMIEQNAREALKLSHRGYVLATGENKLEDTGEALLSNEEVGRLYLGG